MIHTILPSLCDPEDPIVVETCSGILQPTMHGFLDCILILIVLNLHMIYQDLK